MGLCVIGQVREGKDLLGHPIPLPAATGYGTSRLALNVPSDGTYTISLGRLFHRLMHLSANAVLPAITESMFPKHIAPVIVPSPLRKLMASTRKLVLSVAPFKKRYFLPFLIFRFPSL